MPVHVEVTGADGRRESSVDAPSFWIGGAPGCEIRVEVPGCRSRILEVRVENEGRLSVRAEPGLPFPVRSATGNVGNRFEPLIDGDVLNVGPLLLKMRPFGGGEDAAQELDLATVRGPGAPIGSWYETFMDVADHLEAMRDPEKMVAAAMDAVLGATAADRVHVRVQAPDRERDEPRLYFRGRDGAGAPFGVSSSIVERVLASGRAVHVPIAAADPVASRFVSVRREGISSGIALPLTALGRQVGCLYADCIREGAVLTAEDLQRVAFIGRLLAQSLGNRALVASLVRRDSSPARAAHPSLQTESPACADMVERVKLYAPTDYTVLIRGETGSGKEVMARCIHDLSRRSSGPFVPVNCAAIPEQLMESMLFGHEKGAFTGAVDRRRGHFEEADSGTLFLDEIGDMALDLQAKILRALQDRVVTPVGSSRQVKVDVRILAATHQDLEAMVQERTFREDLYYRLRELEILLPPLRERREDILMLTQRFLAEAAEDLGLPEVPELASDTLDQLQRRAWRGNVRELRHTVKGAALRAAGGVIRAEHLDPGPGLVRPTLSQVPVGEDVSTGSGTWKERLELQERAALEETLREAGGNLTKAARMFGVPRTTYREKLVKAGLLGADED
ncbi:MAG: sigma-54-dependent Fis family transcriptional regulator [Planctomycetota bacterium]|nr:sigma-54-dependent Fis family transcriptional regulator [Planctomycetota bacterium]MDA1221831.1 sigma-54-dependent Fis family transcriptional regulator [Planctomycetota bacterium]